MLSEVAGALSNHKKKVAVALLSLVIARATGQAPESNLELDGQVIKSGDVDALTEAATPGLLRAHYWIDRTEKKIHFNKDTGTPVSLTSLTRSYMESEIPGPRNTIDVSVAALNANSKVGRVYFNDLGRTIPFKVAKEANGRTIPTLSRYLTQYVDKTGATVNIEYQPIYYPDKLLKRIMIFDCHALDGEN